MPSFRLGLLLCTTPMLLAPAAQAQSNSCELLKQQLASRIPPEIRGYAMDDVPARTPVPPGGKVIGTCEGGARKVVYRRFGGPPLTADGAAASSPAPSLATASAPATVALPKEAPKPKAEAAAPPPAKPPARTVASAPAVASTPAVAAPKPAQGPPPAPAPAVVAPVKQALVDKPAPAPAPVVSPPPAVPSSPEPAEPAPTAMPSTPAAADDTPGFISAYGRWLWLLLAVPVGALLWSWVSHRMAYDSAGLPRGPRL